MYIYINFLICILNFSQSYRISHDFLKIEIPRKSLPVLRCSCERATPHPPWLCFNRTLPSLFLTIERARLLLRNSSQKLSSRFRVCNFQIRKWGICTCSTSMGCYAIAAARAPSPRSRYTVQPSVSLTFVSFHASAEVTFLILVAPEHVSVTA